MNVPSDLARLAVLVTLVGATACIGKNDRDTPLDPADYPLLGRDAIDPVTPGILHLTFDDGPSDFTPDIIATLDRHGAHATFFMVGRNIPGHRDVLDLVRAHGHQVANHSFYHEMQPGLSKELFQFRIRAMKDNIAGRDDGRLYFRFPYGSAEQTQLDWLAETTFDGQAYQPVGWNLDSQDFTFDPIGDDPTPISTTVQAIPPCRGQAIPFTRDFIGYTQYVARLTGGGVILFHDIKQVTHDHLEEVLHDFEHPEDYWARLAPDVAETYRQFYACEHAPTDTVFRFAGLRDGPWPTYAAK